jgi:hypothetical protein
MEAYRGSPDRRLARTEAAGTITDVVLADHVRNVDWETRHGHGSPV